MKTELEGKSFANVSGSGIGAEIIDKIIDKVADAVVDYFTTDGAHTAGEMASIWWDNLKNVADVVTYHDVFVAIDDLDETLRTGNQTEWTAELAEDGLTAEDFANCDEYGDGWWLELESCTVDYGYAQDSDPSSSD